ncbi:MAG: CsbD family protein [Proteobacteria bacterium]|nr:CsbD family protein [Pseudomonadota bacterium]
MNKEIFSGKWDQVKGKIKQQWGKLTDNDLTEIEGDNELLFGKLKEYYGYNKEQVQNMLDRMRKH